METFLPCVCSTLFRWGHFAKEAVEDNFGLGLQSVYLPNKAITRRVASSLASLVHPIYR